VTDLEMLNRLLASKDLSDEEADAFGDMRSKLQAMQSTGTHRRNTTLSLKQRTWAEMVFHRLELDADVAENLHSSGQVPTGKPVAVPLVLQNLPLRPPSRRI
jgi:hypothetical protein